MILTVIVFHQSKGEGNKACDKTACAGVCLTIEHRGIIQGMTF